MDVNDVIVAELAELPLIVPGSHPEVFQRLRQLQERSQAQANIADASGYGLDCQIAKVIPVGHGGACQYSVAIGSLGIKLFTSLTDAQEVRDAINKAIAAAVSQGGVAGSVQHESKSSESGWVTFGRIKTDLETETQTFERIYPPESSGSSVSDDEIAAIRELRRKMYFPSGRSTGEWAHVDTLLTAYDALKGENERLVRAEDDFIKVARAAEDERDDAREELSRLKAAVPADEVKEQDNES